MLSVDRLLKIINEINEKIQKDLNSFKTIDICQLKKSIKSLTAALIIKRNHSEEIDPILESADNLTKNLIKLIVNCLSKNIFDDFIITSFDFLFILDSQSHKKNLFQKDDLLLLLKEIDRYFAVINKNSQITIKIPFIKNLITVVEISLKNFFFDSLDIISSFVLNYLKLCNNKFSQEKSLIILINTVLITLIYSNSTKISIIINEILESIINILNIDLEEEKRPTKITIIGIQIVDKIFSKYQTNIRKIKNILKFLFLVLNNCPENIPVEISVKNIFHKLITKNDLMLIVEIIKVDSIKNLNIFTSENVLREIIEIQESKDEVKFTEFKLGLIKLLSLSFTDEKILTGITENNSIRGFLEEFQLKVEKKNQICFDTMQIVFLILKNYKLFNIKETNAILGNIIDYLAQNALLLTSTEINEIILLLNDFDSISKLFSYFYLSKRLDIFLIKKIISFICHNESTFRKILENKSIKSNEIKKIISKNDELLGFTENLSQISNFINELLSQECYNEKVINKLDLILFISFIGLFFDESLIKREEFEEQKQSQNVSITKKVNFIEEIITNHLFNGLTIVKSKDTFHFLIFFLVLSIEKEKNFLNINSVENFIKIIQIVKKFGFIDDEDLVFILERIISLSKLSNKDISKAVFSNEDLHYFIYSIWKRENISKEIFEKTSIIMIYFSTFSYNINTISTFFQFYFCDYLSKVIIFNEFSSQYLSSQLIRYFIALDTKYLSVIIDEPTIYRNLFVKMQKISIKTLNFNIFLDLINLVDKIITNSLKNGSSFLQRSLTVIIYFLNQLYSITRNFIFTNKGKTCFYNLFFTPILSLVHKLIANNTILLNNFTVINLFLKISFNCLPENSNILKEGITIFDEILKTQLSFVNKDTINIFYYNKDFKSLIKKCQSLIAHPCTNNDLETFFSCTQKAFQIFEYILSNDLLLKLYPFSLTYLYFQNLSVNFPKDKKELKESFQLFLSTSEKGYFLKNPLDKEVKSIEQTVHGFLNKKNVNRRLTVTSQAAGSELIKLFNNIRDLIKYKIFLFSFYNGTNSINLNMQILKLIRLMKLIWKFHQGIGDLYNEELNEIMIEIFQSKNNSINPFLKNEVALFLDQLIDSANSSEIITKNEKIQNFSIEGLISIQKEKNVKLSEINYHKALLLTKILSSYSSNANFILKNKNILTVELICNILYCTMTEVKISTNLINLLNNILLYDIPKNNEYIQKNVNYFTKLIIEDLFNQYRNLYSFIKLLLQTVEFFKDNKFVLMVFIEKKLVEKIQNLLNEKIDSTLFQAIFFLVDNLIQNENFAKLMLNKNGINSLILACQTNMFNPKIIEKWIHIFEKVSSSQKSLVIDFGCEELAKFCLLLLEKYSLTCYNDIKIKCIDLIHTLLRKEFFQKYSQYTLKVFTKFYRDNFSNEGLIDLTLDILIILHQTKNIDLKFEWDYLNKVNIDDTQEINDPEDFSNLASETFEKYYSNEGLMLKLIQLIVFEYKNEDIAKMEKYMNLIITEVRFFLNRKAKIIVIQLLESIIKLEKINEEPFILENGQLINILMDILTSKEDLEHDIYLNSIELIKDSLTKERTNKLNDIPQIIQILLQFVTENKKANEEDISLVILEILFTLSKKKQIKVNNKFLLYILRNINEKFIQKNLIETDYTIIFENFKQISIHFQSSSQEETENLAKLLISLMKENFTKKLNNNLIKIFEIISNLVLQDASLKQIFNNEEYHLPNTLNSYISALDDKNDNSRSLIYQIKMCLMYLEEKGNILINKNDTGNIEVNENSKIDNEAKDFLLKKHNALYYNEKGDKLNCEIYMDNKLEKILVVPCGEKEILDSMKVDEMESCVRNCSTIAFKKAKKLFTKPVPKKCFSILGIKVFNQIQKTLSIQCDSEEECIKFVDYLSVMITNKE